jgi:hypothetical protein
MSDVTELLELALAPDRPTPDRMRSLDELRPLLHEESVVAALMAAARSEPSVELRAALLDAVADVDITRLSDRSGYVDAMAYFASLEPERALRVRAIERLGRLADGEEVIADTLVHDLDEGVQLACLRALGSPRKTPAAVAAILAYAERPSAGNLPALVALIRTLDNAAAQLGLARVLSPWTDDEIQELVLAELAAFPALDAATTSALAAYAAARPREDLATRALDTLLAKKDVDDGILQVVLTRLEASPDDEQLAAAFRDRLASTPGLLGRLTDLVAATPSARLKLRLMEVLAGASQHSVFVALTADPNPWVREAAVAWCALHLPVEADLIGAALATAIPTEPVTAIRHAMVGAFVGSRRKDPDVERRLLGWVDHEPDPGVAAALAVVVATIPITDENRAGVLRACRTVITDPFVEGGVKGIVTERLRSFAYRDEPELVACLLSVLERETHIDRVEELHDQLRRLQPDIDLIVPTLLKLFYRFLHDYPREPLHGWLRDFEDAAARLDDVRAQIPYIVRLTGATWILDSADAQARKEELLPAFMAAVEQDVFRGPQRLLDEAYESRTLRKSDLLAIFDRLLDWPGQEALVQHVFEIMRAAKLVTPEIVDRCLDALVAWPAGGASYEIQRFVEEAGPEVPGYRDHVIERFTQEAYTAYCLGHGSPTDIRDVPRTWHDWEWASWRIMHEGWPIAELFFALDTGPETRALLSTRPDPSVPAVRTIHYLVLTRWWRDGVVLDADDYLALGRLLRATADVPAMRLLRERALCLFTRRWNEWIDHTRRGELPSDELLAMAAEADAELGRLHAIHRRDEREPVPAPLRGIDGIVGDGPPEG